MTYRMEMQGPSRDWPSIVTEPGGAGNLIGRVYGPNAADTAARIVACLNACAGIPTEALESGVRLLAVIDILSAAVPGGARSSVLRFTLARLRGEG